MNIWGFVTVSPLVNEILTRSLLAVKSLICSRIQIVLIEFSSSFMCSYSPISAFSEDGCCCFILSKGQKNLSELSGRSNSIGYQINKSKWHIQNVWRQLILQVFWLDWILQLEEKTCKKTKKKHVTTSQIPVFTRIVRACLSLFFTFEHDYSF